MHNRYTLLLASALLLFGAATTNAQENLRDPTRPYNARPVTFSGQSSGGGSKVASYSVTAIFTSDARRVAVVNGQRVIEGDMVDGATVIEIQANSLSLNVRGKVVESRVLPYGLRK